MALTEWGMTVDRLWENAWRVDVLFSLIRCRENVPLFHGKNFTQIHHECPISHRMVSQ